MAVGVAVPPWRVLVDMKVAVLQHSFRHPNRMFWTATGGLVGLGLAGATIWTALGDADLVAVTLGLWALGWIVGPLFAGGGDESLRPEYFTMLPLRRRALATGLVAAAFVGVAPLVTLVALASVVVVGARASVAAALVGVPAALLSVLCLVLASKVTTNRQVVAAITRLMPSAVEDLPDGPGDPGAAISTSSASTRTPPTDRGMTSTPASPPTSPGYEPRSRPDLRKGTDVMDTETINATITDVWDVAALDVDAYLDRIDLAPPTPGLRALHEAHVRAIPFENIDPVLGRTPDLALAAIADKLVTRRRGGYCYEHALLFAAVLQRLGYPVSRRMSRIAPRGPRTHMMLVAVADGIEHLVDVGFGAGMLAPMPLRDGVVVSQAGWDHRLVRDGSRWTLEKADGDRWEPLHAFDDAAALPVDYEVANHYVATHPHSPFSRRLVVMRLDDGISRRLVGDELTVDHADGRSVTTAVAPGALGEVLRDLDLHLDGPELWSLVARHPR